MAEIDEPTKPESRPQEAVPFPSSAPRARPFGRRARIAIIVGAVALVGLVGLGIHQYLDSTHTTYIPASKPVTGAEVPPGWSQYREPASGFAVQLPPGWSSIGMDVLKDRAVLEAKYPQFAAKLKEYGDLTSVATKIKFFATNDRRAAELIIFKQTGDAVSFDEYISTILPSIEKLGAQQLEHHRVTLPAGEAERFAFVLTITGADGQSLHLRYLQYHVLKTNGTDTTLFLQQFIVAGEATDPSDATLEQIADSFKII